MSEVNTTETVMEGIRKSLCLIMDSKWLDWFGFMAHQPL